MIPSAGPSPIAVTVLVTIAAIAPTLVPGGDGAVVRAGVAMRTSLLAVQAVQAWSQFVLLYIIIGATRTYPYHDRLHPGVTKNVFFFSGHHLDNHDGLSPVTLQTSDISADAQSPDTHGQVTGPDAPGSVAPRTSAHALRRCADLFPRAGDIPLAVLLAVTLIAVNLLVAQIWMRTGWVDAGNAFRDAAAATGTTEALLTEQAAASPLRAFCTRALYLCSAAFFSLGTGYREELLYRVWIMGRVAGHGAGTATALVVSVVLFMAGHSYQGPAGMVASGLTGLVLGMARLKGSGLHTLGLSHALYNMLVLWFV